LVLAAAKRGRGREKLDYKQIGEKIRHKRKERKWTQYELAEKCHVSMAFIGHIERGTRIMSMDTFVTICNVLGTSADELLWDTVRVSDSKMQRMLDSAESGHPESYELYVRIMESVAEVMNQV